MSNVNHSESRPKKLKSQCFQTWSTLFLLKQSRNALDCTTNTLKELVKETVRFILHSKPDIVINNSRASMSTITHLILELDGDITLQPDQQLRLRQRTGSSTSNNSWDSWRSSTLTEQFFSYFSCSSSRFRLPEISIPWQSTGGVDRYTRPTSHFHTYSHCTACSHCTATFITRLAWLKTRIVCTMKTLHHLARHVSCLDTRYTQHLHSVLTLLSYPGFSTGGHIFNPLQRSTAFFTETVGARDSRFLFACGAPRYGRGRS